MSSEDRDNARGYGPDDMGDDEQESDVAGYEQYIEDPPDDLVITEDADDDAEADLDWAARHPRAAAGDEGENDSGAAAEDSAVRERRTP